MKTRKKLGVSRLECLGVVLDPRTTVYLLPEVVVKHSFRGKLTLQGSGFHVRESQSC